MKTQTKTEIQTTGAFILVLAIAIFFALLMNSCTCKSNPANWSAQVERNCRVRDSLSLAAQQDTLKWAQFLECSKDQGDWGCDSCFIKIYGFSFEGYVLGE